MYNRKKYKLDDFAQVIKNGYTPSKNETIPYVGLEHIEQGTLRLCGLGNSSDVTSSKFKFDANNILFGKLRPYFRKVYKPKFKGVCSTDIWVIKAKKGVDQNFLFYFLANEDFINLASGGSSGTKMPRADWHFLKNTEWLLPDYDTQKRIGNILSFLDDKIELNRRMNQTLEQIAATLFKKYFVDDIDPDNFPEGWRFGKMSDITLRITKGTTPTTLKRPFVSSGINFLKVETLTDYGTFDFTKLNFIDIETDQLLSRSRIQEHDILFSIAGTLGRIAKATKSILPANTNQALAIIRTDKTVAHPLFIYYLLKLPDIREEIFSNTVQGVQANLSLSVLSDTKILIPKKNYQDKVFEIIEPLHQKIEENEREIKILSSIRDTLLPKLMSGEIDVTAINQNEPLHEEVLI